MLQYLRDCWETAQVRARYQRLAQRRILALLEESGPTPVADEAGNWAPLGAGKSTTTDMARSDLRSQARALVQTNPYARNLLRLLEVYVAGPGLTVTAVARETNSVEATVLAACQERWAEFLADNRRHFSFRETARRTWRDGECFLRFYARPGATPTVRYIDPEWIGDDGPHELDQGVIAATEDVETVLAYRRLSPVTGAAMETIPADDVLHLRVNADSNEKRGVTIFAPVLESLASFEKWLETELQARKLQASIVLWRKVQGSASQAAALAEAATSGSGNDPFGAIRKERYKPGSILTTPQSTELQFLQPQTNFGDAVPLGRLMLLGIAAGAGVPEFMLSADASNANYSSTMVAEGPAVKLFESEQRFFADELTWLWRRVIADAAEQGLLPADVLEQVRPQWSFPDLVNRDRSRERLTDARLVDAGILSRAEVARRDKVDPAVMQQERDAEGGRLKVEG
jgi:capsid protein